MPNFITLSDVYENILENGPEQTVSKPETVSSRTQLLNETLGVYQHPTIEWRGGEREVGLSINILVDEVEYHDDYESVMETGDDTTIKQLILNVMRETLDLFQPSSGAIVITADLSMETFDQNVRFIRTSIEDMKENYADEKREKEEHGY